MLQNVLLGLPPKQSGTIHCLETIQFPMPWSKPRSQPQSSHVTWPPFPCYTPTCIMHSLYICQESFKAEFRSFPSTYFTLRIKYKVLKACEVLCIPCLTLRTVCLSSLPSFPHPPWFYSLYEASRACLYHWDFKTVCIYSCAPLPRLYRWFSFHDFSCLRSLSVQNY